MLYIKCNTRHLLNLLHSLCFNKFIINISRFGKKNIPCANKKTGLRPRH